MQDKSYFNMWRRKVKDDGGHESELPAVAESGTSYTNWGRKRIETMKLHGD